MGSIGLVLGGLFATWVGWWFYARKRGWSQTIAIGGGFIAAMLFVLVCMYAGKLYSKLGMEELPATVSEAGLRDKAIWNDADYNLAEKITLRRIDQFEGSLDDAVNRGDRIKMDELFLAFNDDDWWPKNDMSAQGSPDYRAHEKWRPCQLAALYLLRYAKDGTGKDYIQNNREACQKLVY